jgi:C4-dicarboxylate-specific signal transduction histidine kinase
MSPRFRDSGVRLIVSDFQENLLLECRPSQICEVLLNLLNNAFDAVEGRTDPWVKLEIGTGGRAETGARSQIDDSKIYFRVTDNDSGVPKSFVR